MTPAVKQAKKKKIPFELHHYCHDVNVRSFGLEAAEKLKIDAKRVFKTLVVSTIINNNDQLAVAIIPVEYQLNLKLMAKALKTKKVKMAEEKRVESSTGYVLGGVSPLGQKKPLITIIDSTSQLFDTIFVSGGKRGLEIELSAENLAEMTKAIFSELTSK
tara:strand:- start:1606 stop:2085 length:480 start_codon:yes stop_codon:yes gene_type:complete